MNTLNSIVITWNYVINSCWVNVGVNNCKYWHAQSLSLANCICVGQCVNYNNVNPTGIDYVIPGNDDAVKGIQLLLDYFTAAVAEGAGSVKVEEKPAKKEEK